MYYGSHGKKCKIIFCCSIFLLLMGCGESYRNHRDIKETVPDIMACVISEDVDGLYGFFDQDTKENREKEIRDQLKGLFKYIQGTVVSYEGYSEGGGIQSKNEV